MLLVIYKVVLGIEGIPVIIRFKTAAFSNPSANTFKY